MEGEKGVVVVGGEERMECSEEGILLSLPLPGITVF